jgi:hypothetical protein
MITGGPATRSRSTVGILAAALGVISVGSLALVWSISVLPDFNPPDWIRIGSVLLLLVSFLGSVGAGIAGRRGPGRMWATSGLVLGAATLIGFVIMMYTVG